MKERLKDAEQTEMDLNKEIDLLKDQLQMKDSELNDTKTLLVDERDEKTTLKKKHAAIVKDMGRQLQTMQKKLDSTTSIHQETKSEVSSPVQTYTTFGFHDSNNNLVNSAAMSMMNMLASSSSSPQSGDDSGKYYTGDVKKLIEKTMKLQNELEDKNDQIELLVTKIRDLNLQLASR